MRELLIDDTFEVSDRDLAAGLCGCKPRDFSQVPVGSILCAAPANFPLIPRNEWSSRIKQMEQEKSRLSDLINFEPIPCLNQAQTNYCHANSPALAMMAVRASQGQPFVLLSPASIAGPVTGFQNEGAFIHDDLRQITTVGCASQEFVPANQIDRSGFKPGWEENAKKHRVSEWWDLGQRDGTMFDRVMTLLLSRVPICVAYNWWSHAVTLIDPVELSPGAFGVRFRNSWGDTWPNQGAGGYALLPEGKGTPDEAYAPRSITAAA
jgi:hypothetical protein